MRISNKMNLFDVDLYGFGVVAGLWVLCFLMFIQPLDGRIAQLRQEKQTVNQDTESIRNELDNLQSLVDRRMSLAESLIETKDILQQSTSIDEIVRMIGDFSRKTALRLDEISPHDERTESRFQTTQLTVHLEGTFPKFITFLKAIRQELPYLRVESLDIKAKPKSELKWSRLEMELIIFAPK